MNLQPVKNYSEPRYPTQDILLEHPELLRLVPKRWRSNRKVLAVLSATAMLIWSNAGASNDQKSIGTRIAPLFVHGAGRGAFGCDVVNPPVFLSEDEARQVIQDEAKRAGLRFELDTLIVRDAAIPWNFPEGYSEEDRDDTTLAGGGGSNVRPFVLDGYDRKHQVGFEYVSETDYHEWINKFNQTGYLRSTAYAISCRTAAQRLKQGLGTSQSPFAIGVFYDPMVRGEMVRRSRSREAQIGELSPRQLAEEQLELQVRDFIQWLKAEGII